jgi:hypothetical protein
MSIWTSRIRILAFALAGSLMLATTGFADTVFMVDSIADQIDVDTTDGKCKTVDNTCTLRAAVMSANKVSGAGATIMLPAGIYTLILPADLADGDNNGDLNLTAPVSGSPVITITGAGAAVTIIDANQIDRVLSVAAGRIATISGVTFRNGFVSGGGKGGGIYLEGNSVGGGLTLTGCTLSGNTASGGNGGGIYTSNSLTLNQTTLSGNTAVAANITSGAGGGIYNLGTLHVDHSSISGNIATLGGGIFNNSGASVGTVDMSQSTISGNVAHHDGGGIWNDGQLTIINSTIALNDSDRDGGGIYNTSSDIQDVNIYSSTIAYNDADHDQDFAGSGGGVYLHGTGGNGFNLHNAILAGNTEFNQPVPDDCVAASDGVTTGVLKTHARNLFGNGNNCPPDQISGSYADLSPLDSLGGLQNNGGPTQTIALLAGSNAIDGTIAGVGCKDSFDHPITVDQRGFARGADSACDVGAFECNDIFANGFE